MKRSTLLSFCIAVASSAWCAAPGAVNIDSIPYKVEYKWGFIQKTAGYGSVKMKNSGDTISATLYGRSIPWGGRLYTVNDTLLATMDRKAGTDLPQETVIYENGRYTKPTVKVNPDGSYDISRTPLFRDIRGTGLLSASPQTMEAVTITADMLGMFRYSREIDFSKLSPGQKLTVNIVGDMPGRLELTFVGRSSFMIGNRPVDAWHVTFDYSYQGSMSNYDVNCWIGVEQRFPIAFSADLLIGHVEMVWNP